MFDFQRRIPRLALSCAALALLAACGSSKTCIDEDEPYLSARNNPPLRVPAGLSQPNRAGALTIPEAPASAAGRGPTEREGCLAEPPSYFGSSGITARTPEEVVASWAQSWSQRETDAVLALYSSSFVAPTDSAGGGVWLEQRREQIATGPAPASMLEDLKIESQGEDRTVATFVQRFGTNALHKELTLVRESGSWRIVGERVVEVK
jgi:uncharacterized lipoprotein